MIVFTLTGCHQSNHSSHPGEVYDAGAVFNSSTPTLTHRFIVKNSTGRPIHILSESHSCECTTVDLPRRELQPGESVPLTMSVRVPPVNAKRDVSTRLKTDNPDHPDWDYRVLFESFPDGRIVPDVIDLGAYVIADMLQTNTSQVLAPREAWLEMFTLSDGNDRTRPRLAQVPTECVATMEPIPEVSLLAHRIRLERYRLSVSLKKGVTPTGTFVRPLSTVTRDEGGPSASITWSISAPVAVEPTRLHLGSISSKVPQIRRSVRLRSADGLPFRIISVEPGPCCNAHRLEGGEFPSPASNCQNLELVFDLPGKATSRFLAGSVRIRIDREDYPNVLLPWSALLREEYMKPTGHTE